MQIATRLCSTSLVCREFYVMSEDGSRIELAQRDYVLPLEGIFVVANEEGEVLTFSTTSLAKNKKKTITIKNKSLNLLNLRK